MREPIQILALIQGLYFLATGIWPLISIRAFEAVTGPKTDHWLVKTVGILVGVVGAVLLLAAYHDRITAEIVILATASALGLMAIDIWYVIRRVIPRIYLWDAGLEFLLILAWATAWMVNR